MCYTVWVGLGREYEILESQEVADWMERLAAEEAVAVEVDDSDVPEDVSPGDD
jgi:sulfur carrier protein ThiS